MTSRHWCFTLNNFCEKHKEGLDWKALGEDVVRYAVWQLERGGGGGEGGHEHVQGYVELNKPGRFKTILGGAHFETRKGSREQARVYCMKEDTRVLGILREVVRGLVRTCRQRLLDSGMDEKAIHHADFELWAKQYKVISRHILLNCPQREWRTKLIVLHGDSGTGKSSYVRDLVDGGRGGERTGSRMDLGGMGTPVRRMWY